ncbi:uncharacterized protein Bfra_001148 [Botrytis fragariae]|uniref:Uncharacterized protein n=1 Tax=Botrytis fragariae TaxID=1964551 RepID=A0A8H6B4J2_9HELO|nr:uncharacterized protein Bfra_001148 [Botrytis fragariae]KAF5878975.1 hypothetical protein Bfra_001148 [Botrytis fragariae]
MQKLGGDLAKLARTSLNMRLSIFLSASTLLLTHLTKACYFNVYSTTVGTFKAQHSEPLDHNGAPQTLTGKYLTCSFSADLADGCIVTVKTNWTTKTAGGQES